MKDIYDRLLLPILKFQNDWQDCTLYVIWILHDASAEEEHLAKLQDDSEFIVALKIINTKNFENESVKQASFALLSRLTGVKQTQEDERLPALHLARKMGERFAESICLGREIGSLS